MHGSIKPVRMGSGSYGSYLEKCSALFSAYLESHGSAVLFSRMSGGSETEGRLVDAKVLDAMLRGEDPSSGEKLRDVKDGQIGCYDIPLNDCKELEVLGVRYEDVRDTHRVAQRRGMKAVESYLSKRLLARRRNGGKTRFVRSDQLMFSAAEHWTSRDGDPHMHTHLVLANMCLADGKWVAVDSRQLYHMYENIRSVYETTVYGDPQLRAALASHGAGISLRGGIPQLVEGAEDVFSKRRDEINRRLAELVEQWRTNHAGGMVEVRDRDGNVVGHTGYQDTTEPDRLTMVKLRQQAWADTRKAKGDGNTRVDWQAWLAELEAAGYDPDHLLDGSPVKPAPLARDVDGADMELCALNAVNALSEMHSAWSRNDLEVAVYDQIRDMDVIGTRAEIETLADRIMAHAVGLCANLDEDPRATLPFMKSLTSNAVVECETDLKGRLAARGIERSENLDLEGIAEAFTLDPGQREAVETICKGDPLTVVEGAAGAGKTHMLKAVKSFCDATGRRLMLTTPYRKAAEVAAGEVGADACTVMKLLEAYGYRHDEKTGVWDRVRPGETDFRGNTYRGVPPEYRMDAGTYLVVDESGMMDQEQARRLLAIADETGASVTLVGDTAQKGAVGRGGVLAMAKRYTANVVDMTDVHRFADPDYAAFSLRLRAHSEATAPALARETLDRGMVSMAGSDEATVDAIADEWMRVSGTTISTGTNRQANAVNAAIQERRHRMGQLGGVRLPDMVAGEGVRVGDVVMCRANDNKARVFNREVYTVDAIHGGSVRLRARDGGLRTVSAGYVREHVQLGYASTTYGAQGITCNHAVYWAAPGGDGSDMYVALTRGKLSNKVFMTAADRDEALETLEGIIGRGRGDNGLDEARRALQERIDQTSFLSVDAETMRIGREQAEREAAERNRHDRLVVAAAFVVAGRRAVHDGPDPVRLARLEDAMHGILRDREDAAGTWSEYELADSKAREAAGLLKDAERERGSIRDGLDAARRDRDIRPTIAERYEDAVTDDPAYTSALDGLHADADRLALAGEKVDGLSDEMRRLDERPLFLRRLDAGKRTDTARSLDSARRELDRLRLEWSARWNETPDAAGHKWQMERIARENAEHSLDPDGQAGRLRAELARIDADGGPDARIERLERKAEENAVLTGDLAGRHARAKTAADKALARVPEWYRSLDAAERKAEADTDTAIRTALDIPGAMERLERLDGLYRELTGREFEPKPADQPAKPQAAATRPDKTAIRTPRTTETIPEPEAGQYLPDPLDPADPLAMTMPGADTGFGFGI